MSPASNTTTNTASGPRSAAVDRVRRVGLALVMVGALSVSVRGQVQAVEPLLGGMSVVLALTNDLAALLALNELMSTHHRAVRRWAWAVLVLAGGTAAGLNTWHALEAGVLPALWAVVVGIGPVLLAIVLSHLIALVLTEVTKPRTVATRHGAEVPTASVHARTLTPSGDERRAPASVEMARAESSRAGQESPAALSGPGVHPALAVVAAPLGPTIVMPPARGAAIGSSDGRAQVGSTDRRVERLVTQLRAGVELTGTSVAEHLGCSPRTGRRLLRQAEERLAVAAAPTPGVDGGQSVRPAPQRGTG